VTFEEPAYALGPATNAEFETNAFRYTYQSFLTPPSVFDLDLASLASTLLKRTPVPGGWDPAHYEIEREWADAADGVRVPISMVRRRGTPRDGSAPCLLYGYGAYGVSSNTLFNSNRFSLLDRGFTYAIAHVRGGGDLGRTWHEAGRMASKWKTFEDFIACAEHLVATRVTASDRLVIHGGSAGGLLMGAVTNLRPELFHAVFAQVPFVDTINTMLDDTLPLTVGEFEEWGNPAVREQYEWMRAYSPYDNLAARDYPAMLVKTGLNDSQVGYWEPAKYVARLRALKTDRNPLLFRVNLGAGHGGSSGRYDALREVAFDYAWILASVGRADAPPAT
jgi:oligopeptidase B